MQRAYAWGYSIIQSGLRHLFVNQFYAGEKRELCLKEGYAASNDWNRLWRKTNVRILNLQNSKPNKTGDSAFAH